MALLLRPMGLIAPGNGPIAPGNGPIAPPDGPYCSRKRPYCSTGWGLLLQEMALFLRPMCPIAPVNGRIAPPSGLPPVTPAGGSHQSWGHHLGLQYVTKFDQLMFPRGKLYNQMQTQTTFPAMCKGPTHNQKNASQHSTTKSYSAI